MANNKVLELLMFRNMLIDNILFISGEHLAKIRKYQGERKGQRLPG